MRVRLFDPMTLLGDAEVRALSPARLVPFYLMASFAYYYLNDNFMEDGAFDLLCSRLHLEWRRVEHPHKHLIDKASLSATTGYTLPFDRLPLMMKHATKQLLQASKDGTICQSIIPTKTKRVKLL